MADIKTLKDNETRVLPRTTSAAIMNDNGEPIENDINSISAPVESAMNTLNTVTGTSVDDVAQSLAELQNIKKELKTAISEKGQDVGDVFSTYPAAVRAIETKAEGELQWIKLEAPTSRAPTPSNYIKREIPVDGTVKSVVLYVNWKDDMEIFYDREFIYPFNKDKDTGFIDGIQTNTVTHPFSPTDSGNNGPLTVQDGKLVFYCSDYGGNAILNNLYYAYIR